MQCIFSTKNNVLTSLFTTIRKEFNAISKKTKFPLILTVTFVSSSIVLELLVLG